MSNQRQQGGDGALNIQAGQNVNYYGMSYAEVKEIVLDLFTQNAPVLVGAARAAVDARVEELTEDFLSKLHASQNASLDALQDPDVQYDLYTAQIGYARSGSAPLAENLVNLLVDRCSVKSQSIEALVLNEAIVTLPKVTLGQANLLTLSWLLRRATTEIGSIAAHGEFLEEYVGPLLENLV